MFSGDHEDASLIESYVLSGDRSAFSELVARYRDRIYNLSLRITGNQADAEDAVQEVFLRLMSKISSFDGRSKFSTWLHAVSVNVCRDQLRKSKRAPTPLPEPERLAGDETTDDLAERHLVKQALLDGLHSLPEEYRIAVVLRDVQGLSYAEVAETLEISEGTVKSRISRGRLLLAKKMAPVLEQTRTLDHPRG